MTPIAYVLYVAHYSINVFDADDWSVVPFVNAALRGHLTFSALWAQHTDNRMLFPNLVFVGLDTLTRANTVVLIALSAALFIASYALFLVLYRSYQSLTPLTVLTFGIVWFSVADYQNALWAFQFAWYFILLCLIGILYCLQRGWFVVALVLAVVASFSSLQGLILWPVGVIWLTWHGWDSQVAKRVLFGSEPRSSPRRSTSGTTRSNPPGRHGITRLHLPSSCLSRWARSSLDRINWVCMN